jgi:hypothetical protein
MKIKTSELTGAALDWAVAVAEGREPRSKWLWASGCFVGAPPCPYPPSTDWSQGGPIIERELLEVTPRFHSAGYEHPKGQWYWMAFVLGPNNMDENHEQHGPTPLIAAMRCYVASKLGDEVDVPEELL